MLSPTLEALNECREELLRGLEIARAMTAEPHSAAEIYTAEHALRAVEELIAELYGPRNHHKSDLDSRTYTIS